MNHIISPIPTGQASTAAVRSAPSIPLPFACAQGRVRIRLRRIVAGSALAFDQRTIRQAIVDGPNALLAFAAGFVSFVSPCCLPLVPGYLAVVTLPPDIGAPSRAFVARQALLFVLSFSLVFILLGLGATALSSLLFDNQERLRKAAGVAILLMGLLFVGSVLVTRLNREWRPAGLTRRAGRGGPVLAGTAFAVAWTPCVGPTLGAILGLAATQQSTAQGAALLAVYSAGLANQLFQLNSEAQRLLDSVGLNFFQSL